MEKEDAQRRFVRLLSKLSILWTRATNRGDDEHARRIYNRYCRLHAERDKRVSPY